MFKCVLKIDEVLGVSTGWAIENTNNKPLLYSGYTEKQELSRDETRTHDGVHWHAVWISDVDCDSTTSVVRRGADPPA